MTAAEFRSALFAARTEKLHVGRVDFQRLPVIAVAIGPLLDAQTSSMYTGRPLSRYFAAFSA